MEGIKKRYISFVVSFPVITCLSGIVISALLALGIPRVIVNDNLKDMMPRDMPSRLALDRLEKKFGGADYLIIGVRNPGGTVFETGILEAVARITEEIEVVDGIGRIMSLANINKIELVEDTLEISPLWDEVPTDSLELERVRNDVMEDPNYLGGFISDDETATAIVASIKSGVNEGALTRAVRNVLEKNKGSAETFLAGFPAITAAIPQFIKHDVKGMSPIILIVLFVLLYLGLRTLRGLALTMVLIILTVLATVGLMGWLRGQFMIIHTSLPIILLAIACADAIHIIAHYQRSIARGLGRKEAVIDTMDELTLPVIVTSITTMAGFLSFLASPLTILGNYGVMISFGVFWALFLSLTFLPAALTLVGPTRVHRSQEIGKEKRGGGILEHFARVIIRGRWAVLFAALAVTGAGVLGIFRLGIELDPLTFLPPKEQIVLENHAAREMFGGSHNLSIIYEGDLNDPVIMQALFKMEKHIGELKGVGKCISIADPVSRINRLMNDDKPEFEVIPGTREAVAQSLLMFTMSASPSEIRSMISADDRAALLNARISLSNTLEIGRLVDEVEAYFPRLPEGSAAESTGTAVFIRDLVYLVVRSSINSILVSLLLVAVIAAVAFRSALLGIFSVIPLASAVIINFGLMGYLGIKFNHVLAMLSSISIGVGIDYAVHYISRYRWVSREITDPERKTVEIISSVGRPIFFNAVSIAAGFAVLMSSVFFPVRYLGAMISFSMLACAFGALTILAVVLLLKDHAGGEKDRPMQSE